MTRGTSSGDNAVPDRGLDQLTELGRVDPPQAAVITAAREVLWSAVAQEALGASQPHDTGNARMTRPAPRLRSRGRGEPGPRQ